MTEEENSSESQEVSVSENGSPHFLLRAVWFVFLGWELGGLWLLVAWLLNVSVVGLPLGIWMINRLPFVMTLRRTVKTTTVTKTGEDVETTIAGPGQRNIVLRAAYFLLVGWWLSLVWSLIGYLACLSIIGLPVGILMLNRLPEVTTLYRHG